MVAKIGQVVSVVVIAIILLPAAMSGNPEESINRLDMFLIWQVEKLVKASVICALGGGIFASVLWLYIKNNGMR